MAFSRPAIYRSTAAGAPAEAAAFAAFFRGIPEVFSGIRDTPLGLVSPPPAGRTITTLAPSDTRNRRQTSERSAVDRPRPALDAATHRDSTRERVSPVPVFTISCNGAISRHLTPSTSKLRVEDALRPAAVRRSSTTPPNPKTGTGFTFGPPRSRQAISKM